MASRRTAGLLVLGSKRDEDSRGGRWYLDGLAMQYVQEIIVSNTHLKNNSIVISDTFMVSLYDNCTATRLRLIKPATYIGLYSHIVFYHI